MISVEQFHCILSELDVNYFTGVPDSTFKDWISYLDDNNDKITNRIAANEGAAVAHCAGYHLATGKVGVVYLQNSGLGNCINPLTSLADPAVYGIPMVLMIGWRGEPGKTDEPQHKKMGEIMLQLLDSIDVPYSILDSDNVACELKKATKEALKNNRPYALIVKKGLFQKYDKFSVKVNNFIVKREDVIKVLVESINSSDMILSTTGFTSRELFEVSKNSGRGHENNFYNVGSMGHVGSIALEVSLQHQDRNVYVLDGDGALIMHMGGLTTIAHYSPDNLTHIVFDNAAYESTGGQTTVSYTSNLEGIMMNSGYDFVTRVDTVTGFQKALDKCNQSLSGIVMCIDQYSRGDLGRPTDTPQVTKERFMNNNYPTSR